MKLLTKSIKLYHFRLQFSPNIQSKMGLRLLAYMASNPHRRELEILEYRFAADFRPLENSLVQSTSEKKKRNFVRVETMKILHRTHHYSRHK